MNVAIFDYFNAYVGLLVHFICTSMYSYVGLYVVSTNGTNAL